MWSRHIELDYHFVRQKVAMGNLVTWYIPSLNQLADIFTKPSAKDIFQSFKSKLSVHAHASLRGMSIIIILHIMPLMSLVKKHIKLHLKRIKRNINMHKSEVDYTIHPLTIKHKFWHTSFYPFFAHWLMQFPFL